MNESSQTEPAEKKEGIITQRVKALDDRLTALESKNGHAVDLSPLDARLRHVEETLEPLAHSASLVLPCPSRAEPNLMVVIAYHAGDLVQVKDLLAWIAELTPRPAGASWDFPVLLVADSTVPKEGYTEIHDLAKKAFESARTILATVQRKGWPQGPDAMFLWAARYIKDTYKFPFLWLEPDCVPLKENWLEAIAEGYAASQFRFMGAVIEQKGQPGMPAKFLAGCAVYPNHAHDLFNAMPAVVNGTRAWDIEGGVNVVEGSENTPLMQHFWGPASDKAPVFIADISQRKSENEVGLDFLSPHAVLFHRVKTNSLISLLRQKKTGSPAISSTELVAPAERLD